MGSGRSVEGNDIGEFTWGKLAGTFFISWPTRFPSEKGLKELNQSDG